MASYDSSDDMHQSDQHRNKHIDWDTLSPEQKQTKINRSRNYLRYRMSKGWTMPTNSPNLTPEEQMICEWINDTQQALKSAKMRFFMNFYDNCPKVGSTLKRKEKRKKEPLHDLIGSNIWDEV